MMPRPVAMRGMPYVPGVAVGRLQRGGNGNDASRIALLNQDEISAMGTVPAGILMEEAAPFSHALITLLGLGVPTVLISAHQAGLLQEGMLLFVDGLSGDINEAGDMLSPPTSTPPLQATPGQPLLLGDGEAIQLYASVRHPQAARLAVQRGAQAIGLVRTEFLTPPEEQQPDTAFYRNAFGAVCESAAPLSVTFRLLDVAADKIPSWFPHQAAVGRPLGLQGVRLYSLHPIDEVIEAQLAALAQLAGEFRIRLLLPFLVRVEEFAYWRDRIRQRLPVDIPVGAMAETPASVLDMNSLLQETDFVAIGCNDLMQSLYATDRDLASLRHYLDPYAPVLFRLLRQVADAAAGQRAQIQLCGVLSQLPSVFPLLLGLGFRTFSVDAPFIPILAGVAAHTTRTECENLVAEVCAARTTQEVMAILQLPGERYAPFLQC